MPITFTFDIETDSVGDYNDLARIRAAFTRLGWEALGGSAWRYPALGTEGHASEDWLNHGIPELMCFRSIIEHCGMTVTDYTLGAHSEAGCGGDPPVGQPIEDVRRDYDVSAETWRRFQAVRE